MVNGRPMPVCWQRIVDCGGTFGVRLDAQQGRICDVPVNTDLPVQTAWDIGVDDAMAIWCFQVYPDHLDIVDYYEGHGQASTTTAHGSTSGVITAPTGCPTTPRCGRLARPERAPGSRRWRCWAASLSWCLTNH